MQITGSEHRLHSQKTIIDKHDATAHGSRYKVEQKACKAASARDHISNQCATAPGSEKGYHREPSRTAHGS
eukprot:scaffold43501_cov71-Phaeocystis_antarctica.AAC.1